MVVRDFPWNPHLWQATPCWCHPWYHVVWRVRQSPAPIWCQREGHQYYLRGASTLSTERTACFSNSLCTLYLVFSQRLGTACDSIILKFSGCLIQYWFVGYFQDLVWHWFSLSFPLFCVVFSNLDNKHVDGVSIFDKTRSRKIKQSHLFQQNKKLKEIVLDHSSVYLLALTSS